AGTGAQEVMSLTHRWGEGISEAIGVGGRDLSGTVGATMSRLALRTLAADPATELIVLVSKPPSAEVASRLLAETAVGAPVGAPSWGSSREGRSPTSPWSSWAGTSARSSPTPPSTRHGPWTRPVPGRTSAWTSATRSSHGAVPTP